MSEPANAPNQSTPPWHLHYEEGVKRTIDIPDIPLHQVLEESARTYPTHTALRFVLKYLKFGLVVESTMTYRELDAAGDRFAGALYGLGVRPGNRVVIMLPNCPQLTIAYFGILKAGGIIVNVNPIYTPRELEHQLGDAGAETILTVTGLYERVESVREKVGLKHIILTELTDTLAWYWRILAARQVRASGMMAAVQDAPHIYRFKDLLAKPGAQRPETHYAPDDTVLLQYSSGTTGMPKGAMLTHRNLVSNICQVVEWMGKITPGNERMLGALPFFHIYGMTVAMLCALRIGGELIMIPDPRQAELVLQIIARHKITFYPGVPASYMALLNNPRVQEFDLRSIEACLCGAASLPREIAQRFEEITQGYLVEGYGLTESSPVVIANPLRIRERRSGSIGIPLPNTTVEIVALEPDEDGNFPPVPLAEQGELVVYGPQVMKGYWNRPDDAMTGINARGGLHTGDIATMDEDGYFYIVDRKKDLIISSGYNVVPREVEEVLFTHPQIADAVVAGVPDLRRGEVIKAYLVLTPGSQLDIEEIRTYCKQNLAAYKVPRMVEFRDELPKNQVGKVLRRLLVEEHMQKQQESEQPAEQEQSVAG